MRIPATDRDCRCRYRGIALLLVCSLAGTWAPVNAPLSTWVFSFPEEEEVQAKDRSALVSSVQPSRRGSLRPKAVSGVQADRSQALSLRESFSLKAGSHRLLTGAGIRQLC